ncbi:Thioredoxin [Pseudarcicella hirudinis]|uniref:Thioredoxin n=1 Tax=Pseudarcicella hirudinis TaxID=1079859 RepID=A0A1I5QD13_9BACT|nr:hypothetical protein [Pseudarcicella hirudinis]SFP44188.1 Thioredoxin [Pseudarcicella hirudinis]
MLKNILYLLTIAICGFTEIHAQNSRGVDFQKFDDIQKVFDLAKAQNKNVFVEAFSPTCQHCEAYIPTFSKTEVGNYYNSGFISYKLDLTQDKSFRFLNKHHIWIPSTPTMMFFDANENLLHIVPAGDEQNNEQGVILFARNALDPAQRTSSYKASYAAGNREVNFLYNYAFVARMTQDTTENIEAMREYAIKVPESQYSSPGNFLILQKIVMDDENPMFRYMISHLIEFSTKNDPKQVKQAAENIIMFSLYSSRGRKFTEEKRKEMKANLAKLGIDAKSIAGRFVVSDVNYALDQKDEEKAFRYINDFYENKPIPVKEADFWCSLLKSRITSPKTDKICKAAGK